MQLARLEEDIWIPLDLLFGVSSTMFEPIPSMGMLQKLLVVDVQFGLCL